MSDLEEKPTVVEPGKSYISIEDHVNAEVETEETTPLVDELYQEVHQRPELQEDEYLKSLYDRETVLRFLRARSLKMKDAKQLIMEDIEWRASFKPHEITQEEIVDQARTGKVRVTRNCDKYNRPVIVMHNHYENTKDYDGQIRHLVYNLERAVHFTQKPVNKYVVFMNLEGFSLWSAPPSRISKEVSKCLSNRYPERLGTAIVYNAPAYFRIFYAVVSPFIDKRTKAKVHFVKGDVSEGSQNDILMKDLIGDNWKFICGIEQPQVSKEQAPGYNFDEFWPTVIKDEEEMRNVRKLNKEIKNLKIDDISLIDVNKNQTEAINATSNETEIANNESEVPVPAAEPVSETA